MVESGNASPTGDQPPLQATGATDDDPVAALATEAAEATRNLDVIMVRRAQEQADLETAAAILGRVAGGLRHWETEAAELDERIHALEGELARTRERLRRAEELLATTAVDVHAAAESAPTEPVGASPIWAAPAPPEPFPWVTETSDPPEIVNAHFPPHAPSVQVEHTGLDIDTVHLVQRHFNESPITDKMRSVRRSLGRPVVNLSRVVGPIPRVLVTVAWEIVWYQFLVDLGDVDNVDDRVVLFAEGMELTELAGHSTEANAALDDEGRVDASELEFGLLERRDDLLTEMSEEAEAALEDATEEVWDRHTPPEFRWDD
jgi:hypothetical protein